MGYAHILSNKGIYDEAIDYYERVIGMKHGWVVPLECLALIYEYKRVIQSKGKEIVGKILALDADNRVGLFVMARQQTTNEGKIEILKTVTEKHPKYARAFNEIGIVYGGKIKDY